MIEHKAPPADVIRALDFWMGEGWSPLRCWKHDRPEDVRVWHETCTRASGEQLAYFVERREREHSEEMLLGLPRRRRGLEFVPDVRLLWVRTDGRDQLRRLRGFRPFPSVVLSEGASSRRIAFWPLCRAVSREDALAANRRLAHAVGAAKKDADPDQFSFPLPGTALRHGRTRPVPIMVARFDPAWFSAELVAGKLKDPPDPEAWKTRAAA